MPSVLNRDYNASKVNTANWTSEVKILKNVVHDMIRNYGYDNASTQLSV